MGYIDSLLDLVESDQSYLVLNNLYSTILLHASLIHNLVKKIFLFNCNRNGVLARINYLYPYISVSDCHDNESHMVYGGVILFSFI